MVIFGTDFLNLIPVMPIGGFNVIFSMWSPLIIRFFISSLTSSNLKSYFPLPE